jgi:hypothetical protein
VSGSAIDRGYVEWLQQESMLARGAAVATQFAGSGGMSQRSFAQSNPRAATEKASVWFTAYPISMITRAGESFLRMLADEDLWRLFEAIGVDAVHTGPVKRAGGISGWDVTPSVDGHFDRISTRIDEAFGTEVEFRSMCEVAAVHGGTIIDDIVPGHTGKGADFRLAEMKVGDYPGIYHTTEPRGPRRYVRGAAAASAFRTVFFEQPTTRAITLIGIRSARYKRRISAQSSTLNTHFPLTSTEVSNTEGVSFQLPLRVSFHVPSTGPRCFPS